MSYATPTNLITSGLPATALGTLTAAQQQAALDNASAEVDSYLRGRYPLPLQAWGAEITMATCVIAAYNVMNVRGYNPASGADVNLSDRYLNTIAWLRDVQKRAAHPNVTPAYDPAPIYAQPVVISSSVVDATGRTGPSRGW